MKKIVIAVLAAAVAAGVLAGCGESAAGSSNPSSGGIASSGLVSSEEGGSSDLSSEDGASSGEVSSQASSEIASSTPSSLVSSKPAASSKPAPPKSPASSKPSASSKPAASSKPPVSSMPEASSVTVKQVRDAIAAAYGDSYLPDSEIPAELLQSQFPVDAALVDNMYGEQPMISVNADTLVVVKAAAGKGAEVEKQMAANRDKFVQEAMVYPKDVAKLHASRVVRQGDYVAFIMLGAIDDNMTDASDSAALEYAKKEVQKGVDAFYAALK